MKDIRDSQVKALNHSVLLLNKKLQETRLLLREWRNKEIVPHLYADLVGRTDKVLSEQLFINAKDGSTGMSLGK
jgi:hypothetical protein